MTLSPTCSAESEIEGWVREGGGAGSKEQEAERQRGEMTERERESWYFSVILTDSGSVDADHVDSAVSC